MRFIPIGRQAAAARDDVPTRMFARGIMTRAARAGPRAQVRAHGPRAHGPRALTGTRHAARRGAGRWPGALVLQIATP